MKYIGSLYKLLLLLGVVFWGQSLGAQKTGNMYSSTGISKVEGVTAVSASSESSKDNEKKGSAVDGDESTMWKSTTSSSSDRNPSITLDLGADYSKSSNYSKIQQIELFVKDVSKVASRVTVYSSDNTDSGWTQVAYKSLAQQTNNIISLNKTLKGRYVRLNFTRRNSAQLGVSEVYFYASGSDLSQVSIKHKKAKWYDLRKYLNINAADNFDEDESQAMHQAYGGTTQIQAAHTLIDTLYVHRGTTVTLTLPDYLDEAANNRTYQRWYNYMTEGTFATDEMGVNVSGVVDLLTPGATASKHPTNGQGYRFANGYVGQPLSSNCLYTMNFYVPTELEGGQNWYLVACDVSGYTDYTEEFNTSTSKNSTFAPDYYEPTLSHRFVYYIRVIEDENSWAAQQLKARKPIEEKDITMAATRLPDKTDEMVALSMDARSYLTPGGGSSEASQSLSVDLTNNTADISLTEDSKSLSGEDRVIFFTYPVLNGDGTRSVRETDDGSDPKATINVWRGSTLVARYNLTFKEDVRLLTQTQVSQENQKQDSPYEYRMPSYLQKNYELLTELNFDFDDEVAAKYGMVQCYPFPLGWNSSTYGFYDGGASAGDFSGPTSSLCPEWGYYGILNSYVECNDINGDSWGWSDYTYNTPNDNDPIRYNSQNNKSTYHLYADVSDRPGVIARLPFDRKLCPGTELFVTAWVKCARGDVSANNAAALFSIMGVKDRSVETSSTKDYVPIFRYQTGQIPATYRNDGGLQGKVPGFAEDNNDWMQVYFSFINTNSDDFESYLLQVDNNSASTNGGDIYIDDIRVYMVQPNAKVTQLKAGCTNERILMNAELNWDQLLSRLGLKDGDQETEGIDFCFIDKTNYENYLTEHPDDYAGAIEASVMEVGKNDGLEGSYNGKYHTLYFKVPFTENNAYDPGNRPNLAVNNTDGQGKYYFYRHTDEMGIRSLSVDFYSALTPNRPYLMLINTHNKSDATLDAEDFAFNVNDLCAIKTEFYVTSETLLRVNGEVIDPSTDFCAGQIFNFSASMRVPTSINEDGTQAYTEIKSGVSFDWFFGSEDEYIQQNPDYGNISLLDALTTFRDIYPENEDLSNVQVGTSQPGQVVFTQDMYNLIQYYLTSKDPVDGGQHARLVLHEENLDITLLKSGLKLVIQPIPTLKSPDGSISDDLWAQVCWSYIPLVLKTSGNAPQLHAGFNSTVYPASDFNPGLRIGLNQINTASQSRPIKMNLRGAVLASLTDGYLGMVTSVTPEIFSKIYLIATNDPAYNNEEFFPQDDFSEYSLPVGQILSLRAAPYEEGSSYEDYMQFYFDTKTEQENGFRFQPKEGYTYTLAIHFEEKSSNAGGNSSNACFGSFTVDMKVVPENVVWNGSTDGTHNWNNDSNWKRADKTELKKPETDSYLTNEENTTGEGFVPMLFTNVIMPRGSRAELYMAGFQNGGESWTVNRPSYMQLPTDNIQYDLMAYDGTSEITTERYRVNICNNIHFEPEAQILHAEQLLYNKASMDVEVTPGVWTMMTTPLRDVVAGDWYTQKDGVQNTEYFKDITFGADYDRLSPAVYQRSWNTAARIVESESADNVPVSFTTDWSAVYNDAGVSYTPGNGFSLKAVPEGTTAPLLFRFPKADTQYDVSTSSSELIRNHAGRLLVSDMVNRSDPYSYVHSDQVDVQLSSVADGTYLMVGNPFMAPLNVQSFLSANEGVLLQKYWYVDDAGTTHAVAYNSDTETWPEGTYWAKPYSVFLVQKAGTESAGGVTVTFTNTMQEWSQENNGTTTGASLFTVKASDGQGSSRATLRYAADAENGFVAAEDAELIQSLDGNKSAAPKVYTVAGDKAVSVNRIRDMRCVPLGVFAGENSTVTLTFQGVDHLKNACLYDARTSSRTSLYENFSLTVDGPSHGRYFIESDGDAVTGINEAQAEAVVNVSSVVPGQIVVTANAGIRSVKVWSAEGMLLRTVAAQGNVCTVNGIDRGMVIVEVTTSEPVVKKVLVK